MKKTTTHQATLNKQRKMSSMETIVGSESAVNTMRSKPYGLLYAEKLKELQQKSAVKKIDE